MAELDATLAVPTHKDELFAVDEDGARLLNDPRPLWSLDSVAWLPPVPGDPRNLLVGADPLGGNVLLFEQNRKA